MFANPRISAKFFRFLPPSIAPAGTDYSRFEGRRIYCDCTNVLYATRWDQKILRVERARLFVR